MANEISVTTSFGWSKNGDAVAVKINEKFDQTGTTAIENIQVIGITSEAIFLGDVTDPRYLLFKNEDETNTVHIGVTTPATTGNAEFSLAPGQGICLTTGLATWYAIAITAPINLLVIGIQR